MLKINSSSNDYSPALNPKAKNDQYKFYFTSSREGSLGKNVNHQTGQPFSDIFRLKGFSKKEKARKKLPIYLTRMINGMLSQ